MREACREQDVNLRVAWLSVTQGDLVGLGDVVGFDGSQPPAQVLASLPQQLEGVGGGALWGSVLRISPVFLDEVGLQGCGDFVGRLQRVVDGPVPCSVVNHGASITRPPAELDLPAGTGLDGSEAVILLCLQPRVGTTGRPVPDRRTTAAAPAGTRVSSLAASGTTWRQRAPHAPEQVFAEESRPDDRAGGGH
jgi:hypothetical protein